MAEGDLRLRGIFGTGFITFRWQDDGDVIEDEILETMRMAVIDLEEIKNILETKIRDYKSKARGFANMKTLCTNFNKITETLLNLWRGTHKLQELQTYPVASFLEHVMRRCYKRSFRNSCDAEVFDKRLFDTVDSIFRRLNMNDDDIFTDINCDLGSVVLQMSACGSFKYCYGISPAEKLPRETESMLMEFMKLMGFYGKDYTEFRLFNADVMSDEMLKIISESTVVFLKDTSVDEKMKLKISQILSKLNEETRLVSFENCERLFSESKDKTVHVEECEGKPCGLRYFVHTVKLQARVVVDMAPPSTTVTGTQRRRQSTGASSQRKSRVALMGREASSAETPSSSVSSLASATDSTMSTALERILDCYRNQFIKFIEFMQSPVYRQQLEKAIKEELLRKTELEEKVRLLTLQIDELSGHSKTVEKKPQNEASKDIKHNRDLLAEVSNLVSHNKELKRREALLNSEINQLERVEIVKECQDQLSHLRNKEDELLSMSREYLLNKAGESYGNYLYLNAKVKSLEAEVALLEGRKENVNATDSQKPIQSFMKPCPKKTSKNLPDNGERRISASSVNPNGAQRLGQVVPGKRPGDVDAGKAISDQHFMEISQPPAAASSHVSSYSETLARLRDSNVPNKHPVSAQRQVVGLSAGLPVGFGSKAHATKRRHGSSSSTDTADSLQDLRLNQEGSLTSSLSPMSDQRNLPVQGDVTHESFGMMPNLKRQLLPVQHSQAIRPPGTSTLTAAQRELEARQNMAPQNPGAGAGRGKAAGGRRGRRKLSASTHPVSNSGKGTDAGSLDALFLAVSLHNLSPSHRNLSSESSTVAPSRPQKLRKTQCIGSAPTQQQNDLTVAMATRHSSFTSPSWSLPRGMEFGTVPVSFVPEGPSPSRKGTSALQPEAAVDDPHGKHFKKKFLSSNLKLERDQLSGSSAVPVDEAAMPILKLLFTKDTNRAASAIKTRSSLLAEGIPLRELAEAHLAMSGSAEAELRLRSDIPNIASEKGVKYGALVPTPISEAAQRVNASWPDALKARGIPRHSLPMPSFVRPDLPKQLRQSDVHRTMGPNILTAAGTQNQKTLFFTNKPVSSILGIAEDGDRRAVVSSPLTKATESRKSGSNV